MSESDQIEEKILPDFDLEEINLEDKDVWWLDYSSRLRENPELLENYMIQIVAFLPFTVILVAFLVLFCLRKVEDYFLVRSLWFFIGAIGLRIGMCFMMWILFRNTVKEGASFQLLQLKVSYLVFTLPVYLYLMVIVALLFSAHNFDVSLRALLFP